MGQTIFWCPTDLTVGFKKNKGRSIPSYVSALHLATRHVGTMPIRLTQKDGLRYDPVHVRLPPDTIRVTETPPPDEAAVCANHLDHIRWPEGVKCPFSGQVGDPYRIQARAARA